MGKEEGAVLLAAQGHTVISTEESTSGLTDRGLQNRTGVYKLTCDKCPEYVV